MHRFFESIIHPACEILQPRVLIEIGIDEGLHTEKLLRYCVKAGAILHAIDPKPRCDIEKLQAAYQEHFVFHKDLSLTALHHIDSYDAVLIDGDHNWYTVLHELRLIEKRAQELRHFPVIFLHDIGWPYGRRDLYYHPENIPSTHRQPYQKKGIDLSNSSLVDEGGLNRNLFHAIHERNIHNGVLTAIEDFLVESREKFHFQKISGFSGLGIIASAALLIEHPLFQEFLENIRIAHPIAQHIDALERASLEYTVLAQQHYRRQDEGEMRFRQIEQELTTVRMSRDRLRAELIWKTEKMQHMAQTRSWRWTVPLRRGESLVWRLSSYSMCITIGILRILWPALGSPFPKTSRYIRHVILGHFWPVSHHPIPPPPPAPPIPPALPEKAKVLLPTGDLRAAIIVVCHNQATLLPQTIESLLMQKEKCAEILIVDNNSADTTREITLRSAGRGVEYLHGTWGNTCAAWNAGLKSTESSLLIFLHAGDILPPEYLHHCREAFGKHPEAAIVYADQTSHQPTEKHSVTPDPFDPERFERENYLPDCSTVRRTALLEVGGWNHGLGENATWITWRRILANGWKAVNVPCIILPPSPTAVGKGAGERAMERLYPPVAPLPQPLPLYEGGGGNVVHHQYHSFGRGNSPNIDATLCLSLSGREWMWPLTREFLEQQTYSHECTHLVIIDTSQDPTFSENVRSWLLHCNYKKHTYIPLSVGLKGLADLPRRTVPREVAAACAKIYQNFSPLCQTPWVFFLEDDIIPPIDVYPRLLQHFSNHTVSISALCMQRSGPHPIAWEWDDENLPTELPHQRGLTAIGGNGFCCVVLRGEYVRSAEFHCGPGNSCYDHNFYRTLVRERGLQALLDWSCVCRHYISPGEWRQSHHPALVLSS